jgi:hypothetical protein
LGEKKKAPAESSKGIFLIKMGPSHHIIRKKYLRASPTVGRKWLCNSNIAHKWLYNSIIAPPGRNGMVTTPQWSPVTTNKIQALGIIALGSANWCSIRVLEEVLTYLVNNV